MSVTIPLKKNQMVFTTSSSTIQLVLKVDSSKAVSDLVDFFSKSVACLHFRLKDENNLEYTKDKIYHYTIPSNITDLKDVSDYVGLNFTPDVKDSFGSIATNEKNKLFVLNVSHRFSDGGFFKFLLDEFNKGEYPKETPILPRFTNDIFSKEIKEAPVITPPLNDKSIFRFNPNKLASPNLPATHCTHYDIKMKASEFKTYDPIKNTPRSITDIMYLSLYFASASYKEKLFDKFSVATVIDLRTLLPYKPDFLNCYHCGHLYPTISNISPSDKLSSLSKRLKDDLSLKRKKDFHFSLIKSVPDMNSLSYGVGLGYSAVGVMTIKRPIIDAYVGILTNCSQPKSVKNALDQMSLFNWSVRDEERKKNDFTTQLWYNQNIFDKDEIKLFAKRIEYFLKNVSLDERIEDVYETIRKIK